jgi:hypothetical protein
MTGRTKITTSRLNRENWDGTVGRMCPDCGFLLAPGLSAWETWPPIAVVKAPWIGGFASPREWATVKECPKCSALCWSHTDEFGRTLALELIAEAEK